MSGGVDSSVSALLLHQGGDAVHGVFMKNWEDYPDGPCPAEQDAMDAMGVCDALGIPFDAVNFAEEYRDRVFSLFLAEYRAGRTPNPDVLCNQEVKFKAFLDHAMDMGADIIATGHYARVECRDERYLLLKAADANKDQTYFLHTLNQYQLSKVEFPLGALDKPAVRRLARDAAFSIHDKKDSTGICFIGEHQFQHFLSRYFEAEPGEIREFDTGDQIGEHKGLMFHTIGQRQGLGIGGRANTDGRPWYVCGKSLADNVLYVVQGNDHPALYHDTIMTSSLHWISGVAPRLPLCCHAKTRYRQAEQPCMVTAVDGVSATVVFDEPQWAMTPGQSVVFYSGEVCLGGGVIDQVEARPDVALHQYGASS